jgi:hypothetical protein
MSEAGLHAYQHLVDKNPKASIDQIHRQLLPLSLKEKTGLLLNHEPGLLLFDNSHHHQLFHCRSCQFSALDNNPNYSSDAPMYAFNEIGLTHYLHSMDEKRGQLDINHQEMKAVKHFLQHVTDTHPSPP